MSLGLQTQTWGRIFSYVTVAELVRSREVCAEWNEMVAKSLSVIDHLDFGQFWPILGVNDPPALFPFIGKCTNINSFSLAYCHHIDDKSLLPMLNAITAKSNVRSISLFYCYGITDQSARFIVRTFKNLESLNLGSCFDITDKSIQAIAQYGRNIKRIVISHNEHFTNDILIDLSTMVNLEFVDIQKTKIEAKFVSEQREQYPAVDIIGPERVRIVFAGTRPPRESDHDENSQAL